MRLWQTLRCAVIAVCLFVCGLILPAPLHGAQDGSVASNMDVLRAATIHGAIALGLAQDLGSIELGKLADLIVFSKDPLADIHNTNSVKYVMKNGEMFEGDTMNEVWPEEKPLALLWWGSDKPANSAGTMNRQ